MVTYENIYGKYPFDGDVDANNFGYLPFNSEQDILDYFEVDRFLREFKFEARNTLTIEKVNKIKEIIKS